MSLFAQLGAIEKSAASNFRNPYVAQAPTPTAQPSWMQRNIIDNPWIEGAAGLSTLIPVVGGGVNAGWEGIRAAYHTAQGNYGKAAEAGAWGAAGFIPGGGVARTGQFLAGGAKALKAGQGVRAGLQAARTAGGAYRAAAPVGGAVARTARGLGGALATGAVIDGATSRIPNAQDTPATTPPAPGVRDPNGSLADQLAFQATKAF